MTDVGVVRTEAGAGPCIQDILDFGSCGREDMACACVVLFEVAILIRDCQQRSHISPVDLGLLVEDEILE